MGSRAEIYKEEFEQGLRLSFEHAQELIDTADMLEKQGKESSATFLALHAREELGRALLILDDVKANKPWISEKRWNDKLKDHKHKLRRVHMAYIETTGYKETPTLIGVETLPKAIDRLEKGEFKWGTDGETSKKMANYDMDERDDSLYVDHKSVGGRRQWVSPLKPVGISNARANIDQTKFISDIVRREASKQGITL